MSVNFFDMSREQLLSEHSEAVEYLQKLRAHINSHSPINRLPVEIIVEIFKYATSFSYPALPNSSTLKKLDNVALLTLVRVTHVCRLWRDIAVDYASLWKSIHPLANEHMTKLCLERSRQAPMTAHIVVRSRGRKAVDSILGTCAARLHTIHVLDSRTAYTRSPPLYRRPLQCVLPSLRCCIIVSKTERRSWSPSIESSMPVIFANSVPELRALALEPVTTWLPGNSFPELTHLYLSFSGHSGSALLDHLRRLLSLLANTPRLAHLQLREVGNPKEGFTSSIPFTQNPDHSRVALRHLRHLWVSDSRLQPMLTFLQCLDPSDRAVIQLSGIDTKVPDMAASYSIPRFAHLNMLTHLELSTHSKHLHFAAGTRTYGGRRSHSVTAGFHLHATTFQPDGCWKDWLTSLHKTYPLSSIETLHVCLLDTDTLPALLAHMPRLLELGVLDPKQARSECEPRLKSLCAALGRKHDVRDDVALCPRLQTLCLETRVRPDQMPSYSRVVDMAWVRQFYRRQIRRIVVRAVLPWRPWEDQRVEEVFAGLFGRLGQYVDEVEYRGANDEPVCSLGLHRTWAAVEKEAETYWDAGLESHLRDRATLQWIS